MRRARLLAVLLALVAGALVAPAGQADLRIGSADQKPDMFSDPRFQALGLHDVRYSIGWDAIDDADQRAELDAWVRGAQQAGATPLLSLGHSLRPGRRRVLPTPQQFGAMFRRYRARYPSVTEYAVWNEANYCGEPVCHRVKLVVAYYRQMRRICPSCTILAAELLDFPNMVDWVREFQRDLGSDPPYWGLHNYRDANRLQTANSRALLGVTSGEIWYTETGGIVKRRNTSTVSFDESPAHAAKAVRWVFDDLVNLSPRITRVFLYQWNSTTPTDTWDSAFIGSDGTPRPAFAVLQNELLQLRPQTPAPAT